MFNSFSEFMQCVAEARFTFKYIWQWLKDLYFSIADSSNISWLWDKITSFVEPYISLLLFGSLVLGIVICLFGKKIIGILKFVAFFIAGYAIGVYFLSPVIPDDVPIPAFAVGLVVAIVAAVASKFLFVGIYSVAVMYSVYRLCYYGFFLGGEPVYSFGKTVTSLAVALVVLIVSLILFKFVEMLLTASLGSWIAVMSFSALAYDLSANTWIVELVVFCIVAVIGFVFQAKTRRRY